MTHFLMVNPQPSDHKCMIVIYHSTLSFWKGEESHPCTSWTLRRAHWNFATPAHCNGPDILFFCGTGILAFFIKKNKREETLSSYYYYSSSCIKEIRKISSWASIIVRMRQPSNNPSVSIAYLIKPKKKKQKTKYLSVIIKKLKKAKNKKNGGLNFLVQSIHILFVYKLPVRDEEFEFWIILGKV